MQSNSDTIIKNIAERIDYPIDIIKSVHDTIFSRLKKKIKYPDKYLRFYYPKLGNFTFRRWKTQNLLERLDMSKDYNIEYKIYLEKILKLYDAYKEDKFKPISLVEERKKEEDKS